MKPTPEDKQAHHPVRFIPSREVYQPKAGYMRETGNEKIPSLRGSERIPHALPLSMAGGAR